MKETSCYECGQIQESLKLHAATKVIVSQALLFPGREGAETSCRLKKAGKVYLDTVQLSTTKRPPPKDQAKLNLG